ncbi:hypothetical protein FNO222_1915 [Francisella orientalis]|uniref:NADH dehydrogenase subunit 5 n=1 Tax=Francisella orientalis TaxID=299583 RepID=A0ABN4H0N2_9GAMM|nr:Hypothetical protein FNO24_1902 [Francisella orientalis FNO24]AKN89441.1 Hypothetical protein FNO190_1900 [Francisella orientalis]AKU06200.1 Hypothetical protein FNO01_1900 [Francisella orientalis]QEN21117.1 hypothetical protein FNO39_1915 [Francisella orientalis]QEN22672.1 hypothetical protein FNO44_1917 [Francisella orientalis]
MSILFSFIAILCSYLFIFKNISVFNDIRKSIFILLTSIIKKKYFFYIFDYFYFTYLYITLFLFFYIIIYYVGIFLLITL